MRALEKDPGSRFNTAAELALALSSCSLAGAWTFGDATTIARRSSRPPTSAVMAAVPPLTAPRVPREWADLEQSVSETLAVNVK